MRKRGFTLVEIMIVVAIIGLLAAIAIPNFIQARTRAQTNACVANLKQLEGAISLYALDAGLGNANAVTLANLVPDYIKVNPHCSVAGATVNYGVTTVANNPTCTSGAAGHNL